MSARELDLPRDQAAHVGVPKRAFDTEEDGTGRHHEDLVAVQRVRLRRGSPASTVNFQVQSSADPRLGDATR